MSRFATLLDWTKQRRVNQIYCPYNSVYRDLTLCNHNLYMVCIRPCFLNGFSLIYERWSSQVIWTTAKPNENSLQIQADYIRYSSKYLNINENELLKCYKKLLTSFLNFNKIIIYYNNVAPFEHIFLIREIFNRKCKSSSLPCVKHKIKDAEAINTRTPGYIVFQA